MTNGTQNHQSNLNSRRCTVLPMLCKPLPQLRRLLQIPLSSLVNQRAGEQRSGFLTLSCKDESQKVSTTYFGYNSELHHAFEHYLTQFVT